MQNHSFGASGAVHTPAKTSTNRAHAVHVSKRGAAKEKTGGGGGGIIGTALQLSTALSSEVRTVNLWKRQRKVVSNIPVPDDVIPMIHRNVQPHVSIKVAGYRLERTLMGCADPPGGRCTPSVFSS